MAELFILAFLGHIVGDFLLQPYKMARGKSSSGLKGALICTAHVCIYTISVCVMMQTSDLFVIASVFIPHWIIDRWSLGEKWLKLIRGRTIQQIVKMEGGLERDFAAAFYAVVYTVVDNTFHLLCILGTIKFLMI